MMRILLHYCLPALLCTLWAFDSFSQDSATKRNYQWELSAGALGFDSPFDDYWFYHLGAGMNFPAKKHGWYNNFSLNATRQGMLVWAGTDYFTLTAGKHRQWVNNHLYTSLGINTGIFFAREIKNKYGNTSSHVGIAAHPRGEIGLSYEQVKISFGVYFSIGGGYMKYYPDAPFYYSYKKWPWFELTGAMSPYLKIIF